VTIGYTQLYPTLERATMVATTDYAQDGRVTAYQWVDPHRVPPAPVRYLRKISWWRGGGWELFEETSGRWTILVPGDWLVVERIGWRRVAEGAFPRQWTPTEPPLDALPGFDAPRYLAELETLAIAVLKTLDPHPYAVVGYLPDATGLCLVTQEAMWKLDLPHPALDPETQVTRITEQVIEKWEQARGRAPSAITADGTL